jgi:hypothetical protein
LKYKFKIIGGTSPRTLFFASPDAEETNIKFGRDIMLDDQLLPLYRRDKEYVKYLYALSKATSNFNDNFPEFNQYLVKTLEELYTQNPSLHAELMTMDCSAYLRQLKDVVFNDNAGEPLEIIQGVPQKQYVKDPTVIEAQSDFVINTSNRINGLKPLVLPVEPLSLHYTYTEDKWNVKTIVPAEDVLPLDKRILPDQGDVYPYLTMNDFLSDSIIKLPYEVNSNKFLTVGNKKFLLPIKEDFFKYFSVEDIKDKNLIETSDLAGNSVEVRLSIPIKKGYITYKKIYYPIKNSASQKRDPKKRRIIEKPFALSVYPFVSSTDRNISYTVGIADVQPNKSEEIGVSFYKTLESGQLKAKHQTQRASEPLITQQSIIDEHFDAIALKVGTVENIIIPKWINYKGNSGDNYHFAIDFGTTNSHIEYKIQGQGSERAYDITESNEQIAFLMPADTIRRSQAIRDIVDGEDHLKQEVISERFGKEELRNAPFRTCLAQNVDVNYTKPTKIFADANIAFDYEKLALRKYLKAYTDLKWAIGDGDDKSRIELYIEEMLMLCKNKVLMNNGNLSNTKVTWFYPVSMTTNHLNKLRRIWHDKFEKVFNIDEDNLIDYPESIAPFYYYKAKGGIKTQAKPSVSIDIGGGTSDVMIFAEGEPQLITYFKFAGNAIFGDGFNGNISNNGFVQKYYPKIKDILTQNNLKAEVSILDKIYEDNSSSADLVNFFFSLKNNKNIKDQQLELNFSKMLEEDSEFKILFLIFYSSIVYHIAEMMKIKGMDTPRNILFSGTGSKTLKIIDSDTRLSSLTELFEEIFNKVYGVDDSRIRVKTDPNPKELTCKGGFHIDENLDIKRHTKLVEVSLGNINNKQVQNRNDITDDSIKYQDVDKEFRTGVIDNIEKFYDVFSELNKTINFRDEFGVSQASLNVFNQMKSYDLEDFIMDGIDKVKADSNDDEPLSETLFFYPLVGKLNELATEIYENE